MKTTLTALLAAVALGAIAAPALAHEPEEREYGQYFGGYQSFDALYQHEYAGIQHALRDGSYSRREAGYFLRQLDNIRRREAYYRSRDGYLNPWEGRDIQARLERLHDVMHEAHEEGHERQDAEGDWSHRDSGYQPHR